MPEMSWRPAYLRAEVLVAFCIVFALMVVALEILIMLSARNNGIASGAYNDHYLWTYGPTAFLTVVAAIFSRVEYQSKMIAPWEYMSKQPTAASKSLLLDYVSQIQPLTIYRSLKNRDYIVSAAAVISVLLKIMTILSTGLITLSFTAVNKSEVPMVLQNTFVDDDTMLKSDWELPTVFMSSLKNYTGDYPFGITRDFAYQTVETDLPVTAQIQVTLDGLTNSLACEPATLVMNEARLAAYDIEKWTGLANLTVTSPGCKITGAKVRGPDAAEEDELPYSPLFGGFSEVRCDGATDDTGKRVLIWFGQMEWFVDEAMPAYIPYCFRQSCQYSQIRGKLLESAHLLCSPTYEISRVDLIKNGTEMQTVELSHAPAAQNRTLDHITPWSIMTAQHSSFGNWYVDSNIENLIDGVDLLDSNPYTLPLFLSLFGARGSFDLGNGTIIDVDPYTQFLLESQFPAGANASSLYDVSLLERLAQTFYRQFGAIIAHLSLMQPQSTNTTGSALVMMNRLMVRSWSGQWMAGIAAVCSLLTAVMVLAPPTFGILPCSPSSLSGLAVLMSHNLELLIRLRDAGDADEKCLSRSLKSSKFQSSIVHNTTLGQPQFAIAETAGIGLEKDTQLLHQSQSPHAHPGLLHPWTRLALCVTLFGAVAVLEVTWHKSERDHGLGDVLDDTYIHYLWTSMPALFLEGIVLMISSMEFNIRSLAPYIVLSGMVNAEVFLDLELLDMSTPWAIYKEARLRSLGALATTMTLLIASFFTIFSSSLFQATSLPQISSIGLRMSDFCASDSLGTGESDQGGFTSLLILEGNQSYPRFTYEDLVFPELVPMSLEPFDSMSNSSTLPVSIKTEIPALRARLTCRMYNSSSIRTRLWVEPSSGKEDLIMTIENETCILRFGESVFGGNVDAGSGASYFGIDDVFYTRSTCSPYFYAWGRFNYSANPPVQHIAALACNETIEVVDVAVDFAGTDLHIDPQRPPSPLEATARNSSLSVQDLRSVYLDIPATLDSREAFTDCFALLTTSRFAVTLEALGDPARDEEVAAALRFQRGILRAQDLHTKRAPPTNVGAVDAILNDAGAMVTVTGQDVDSGPHYMYRATATDEVSRRRVIQDAASTRVLQALLLSTAVLLLVGWTTLPRTNVPPDRSPTTIAGAVALLAGGNLLERLPEDAEWRGKEGVRAALGKGTRLWLGWGRMPDEEGIAMGNENENGVSRFGIFVVPPDEETSSEASVGQRGET